MQSKLLKQIIRIQKAYMPNVIFTGNGRTVEPEYENDYVANLQDNLCHVIKGTAAEKQYRDANGGELCSHRRKDGTICPAKMSSVRSSSAMTYNMLGNGNVFLKDGSDYATGAYNVTYEKKMPTIRTAQRIHEANLDACLENEMEIIFCEMKMTEWIFNSPGELKKAYTELKDNYINKAAFDIFAKLGESIREHEFKRYDAPQMYKHTLAIYNEMVANKRKYNKVTLLNVVWQIPKEQVNLLGESRLEKTYLDRMEKEDEEFHAFIDIMLCDEVKELFSNIGVDSFDICFITAKDFIHLFEKNEKELTSLKRYTLEEEKNGSI